MPRKKEIKDYKVYGRFYVTWNAAERTYTFYTREDKINPLTTADEGDFQKTLDALEAELEAAEE